MAKLIDLKGHAAMQWKSLPFGRYRGKSLPQVLLTDPGWLLHIIHQGGFKCPKLRQQEAYLTPRARAIALPPEYGVNMLVEYFYLPNTGRLENIGLCEADRGAHVGSSRSIRSRHFNLFFLGLAYDRGGDRILIEGLKTYVFGDRKIRLTRSRCERFFEEDNNFCLPSRPRACCAPTDSSDQF